MTDEMSFRDIRWPALGAFAVALIGLAVLAVSARQDPAAPLASLDRPATPVKATTLAIRTGGYRVVVELSPNRASTSNWLSVKVSRRGRPATIVRARVSFSMPAMNMWDGYTGQLSAHSSVMAGVIPVLGMAGVWQLRLTIAGAGARRIVAVVNDRLSS